MPPAISVALPTYNGEHYVEQCVRSVLAQTHSDFELVIGDDGSQDRTPTLLRSFSDPRVRLLAFGKNRGLFPNLNRIVGACRAGIIHVLCQDDAMEPECLAEELRFFTEHPTVAMLYSKFYVIDKQGREIDRCELGDLPEILPPSLALQHFFYHGCIPSNLSSVAFRTDRFEETGYFDNSYGVSADYERWVRFCERWDMGIVHRHLLRIRRHAGQLSRGRRSHLECIEANCRIRQHLLPLLPSSIQGAAARFERQRHFALDVHYAIRCLLRGHWVDAWKVASILGPRNFWAGLVNWAMTHNNHRRPQATFLLPTPDHKRGDTVRRSQGG